MLKYAAQPSALGGDPRYNSHAVVDVARRRFVSQYCGKAEAEIIAWALNRVANGDALVACSQATYNRIRAHGENASSYGGPTEGVAPWREPEIIHGTAEPCLPEYPPHLHWDEHGVFGTKEPRT